MSTRIFLSSSSVLILLLITTAIFSDGECHRILGIFPLNSRSHMKVYEALMKGLAERGHQVDVISLYPQEKAFPNYTDIIISMDVPRLVNNLSYETIETIKRENVVYFIATKMGNIICEKGLADPRVNELIQNPPRDPPYDLVIIQSFSPHCFMAFGHHLKVPVIAVSTSVLYPWGNDMIGNPENLAFVSNNFLEYQDNMNLWQRLINVVHTFYVKKYFHYYISPQDELISKHFGPETPGVRELERDISLILVNSHFSLNGIKPTTPAHVEIGGIHMQNDYPEIPEEDRKWLDESVDGFIYFTFGSMVTIETFPLSILKVFYTSFEKIAPIRVLIKISKPEMLPFGLPFNVRTFSWIPQQAVLKHKNIRAFITHGGLLSTQEAISNGVPMIGVPLFADQYQNIDLYVKNKIAVRLDYTELTEQHLDTALKQILHNNTYRHAVKEISLKFWDRPQSPRDTAVYWVEYILKYGGKALRSRALDLTWWQVALLDVYLILLLIFLFFIIIILYSIYFLISKLCNRSRRSVITKKFD